MGSLFMLMFFIERLCVMSIIVTTIVGIYVLVCTLVLTFDYGSELNFKDGSKRFKLLPATIIFGISLSISIFTPTKREMLTFSSLVFVDNYNDKNEGSNLTIDSKLKLIDDTISKVDDYLNSRR